MTYCYIIASERRHNDALSRLGNLCYTVQTTLVVVNLQHVSMKRVRVRVNVGVILVRRQDSGIADWNVSLIGTTTLGVIDSRRDREG